MKILVISNTTWDNSISFGNTFSNLFENLKGVEIYNVALKHGVSNNTIVKKTCQLSDKAVLKSILKFKFDPARIIENETNQNDFEKEVSISARKKRRTVSFIIRDLIWKFGKWKKSKTLNSFINEIKPDVVYLPIYASPYMCDVQSYLVDKVGVKAVGHISDDVLAKTTSKSPLAKAYNKKTIKKVKALIKKCEYLEVFAENMKREYERCLNVPCYLIGKGIDALSLEEFNYSYSNNDEIKFIYTGNIGTGRYKVLSDIGSSIDKVYPKAKLYIYSATPLTSDMEQSFSKSSSIKFMGAISSEDVKTVQQQADYLVHVESFSAEGIRSAKMSFSTKIIDYMLIGKPIFAVGPKEVNSIEVLKDKKIAIVCDCKEDIEKNLHLLSKNEVNLNEISNNLFDYLVKYRDINIIQKGIKERLESLVNESCSN